MSAPAGVDVLVVGVLVLLYALLFTGITAISSVRRPRIQQLAEEGHAAARMLERILDDPERFLTATQASLTLLSSAIAAFAALRLGLWAASIAGWMPAAVVGAVLLLLLVLGQTVPRSIALRYAEPLALLSAYPIRWLIVGATPLVALLDGVSAVSGRLLGRPSQPVVGVPTEEEIMIQVDAGVERGILEEEEKQMIHAVFDIGDTLVREIMVPRVNIVAVEADTPLHAAVDLSLQAGHSRIPVYEGTIDNIVGVFYARDSIRLLREGLQDVPVREVMRQPYFIPETKKVSELLRELQQKKVHMAIVVDEYGGTAGLVTIEDILEEIVGEIQDEYDREESPVQVISDNEMLLDALLPLDDASELLGVRLEAEDVETLGGFVYEKLGRVAAVGDEVRVNGVTVIVEAVEGNRIRKLRVRREGTDGAPGQADRPEISQLQERAS
jgi:putative hemolysin